MAAGRLEACGRAVAGATEAGHRSGKTTMVLRFIMRFLAVSALAIAVIVAVIDAARSIGASRLTLTSVESTWTSFAPQTFEVVRTHVESLGVPYLWDPIALALLSVPTAAFLAVLALIFYALGYRRDHPASRYALR